jgi:hypothetical protein
VLYAVSFPARRQYPVGCRNASNTMITDVYVVPFADLKRAVGSKDRQLLKAIQDESGFILNEADGYLDKGANVTCADALADLIDGTDFGKHPPKYLFRYRCALEAIWAYLGDYVGEMECDGCTTLDKTLASLDIPLGFSELVSGDEVVPLPAWNDVPCVGSWSPEQVASALPAVRQIDLDALAAEGEDAAEAVGRIRIWVEEAASRPGWGVVAFSF